MEHGNKTPPGRSEWKYGRFVGNEFLLFHPKIDFERKFSTPYYISILIGNLWNLSNLFIRFDLQAAGTILTYELVLMQFQSNTVPDKLCESDLNKTP